MWEDQVFYWKNPIWSWCRCKRSNALNESNYSFAPNVRIAISITSWLKPPWVETLIHKDRLTNGQSNRQNLGNHRVFCFLWVFSSIRISYSKSWKPHRETIILCLIRHRNIMLMRELGHNLQGVVLVPGRISRYLKSGYSTMYLYSTTHYVLHFSSLLLAGGYSYRMLIVLLLLMTLEFTLGGIIFNKVQKSQ